MKRSVKIGLICGISVLLLVVIGVGIYVYFFSKTSFSIVGVEKTEYTVADFADKSELKFYQDGTFHVRIEHKTIGLILTGIGTYQVEKDTYKLSFVHASARDTSNNVVDITGSCEAITCKKSGSRIKFTDHNAQIYYFG